MPNEYAECLVHLMQFETGFTRYRMSSGTFFHQMMSESAKSCLSRVRQVLAVDEFKQSVIRRGPTAEGIDMALEALQSLADQKAAPDADELRNSHFVLETILMDVKMILMLRLGVKAPPPQHFTTEEWDHWQHAARWQGVLPPQVFNMSQTPEKIFREASSRRTISVVADIRRSQDLMIYTESAKGFSDRLMQLIGAARSIAARNAAVFDKFTGDGFLVHFNEEICEASHQSFFGSFLKFCREVMAMAEGEFALWLPELRKVPAVRPGLAMGADLGVVEFHERDNELIAVGTSIVWASRMAAAALSGDVLVNNLLRVALEKEKSTFLEARGTETKNGESFTGWPLNWKVLP